MGKPRMFSFKKSLFIGRFQALLACLFFVCLGFPVYAQVENATSTADPGRTSQELLDVRELPRVLEKIEVKDAVLEAAPDGAEHIKFQLNSLQILGVGAYGPDDLDPLYRDKLGTTVSLADIYVIANMLTNKYRNEGYILTQVVVPPQTIEGGFVTLRVVEGVVDQIIIHGEPRDSAVKQIRKYADNLREGNALSAYELERYLLLINDLPGVTARSILSPSKTKSGASDLTVIVDREKYEADVSFDNHGSRYLGPYRGSINAAANSVFGLNERIGGQFVIGGDKHRLDELFFGAISYEQILSRFGSKISFLGSITSTEPGADLDTFDVNGLSKFFSVTLSHPFIRSRTTNFSGRGTFDYRNVDSKNNLEPSRHDRIRSIRLGTTFQFMDTLMGVGINALDLELSQGVGFLAASNEGDANLTRLRGNPRYTKAKLQMQRLQRLSPSMNFLASAQGQLAATPLLSSEEFGVGGDRVGRGYDPSEIVGDDGISGSLELQWNEPKKIDFLHDYQLFSFVDIGRVWNQDATTSATKQESLASAGLGVRADITEKTKAGFSVAFPLTRQVDITNDNDPRYYFNIMHEL